MFKNIDKMSIGGSSIDDMNSSLSNIEPADWFMKKKRELSRSKKSLDGYHLQSGGSKLGSGQKFKSGMGVI